VGKTRASSNLAATSLPFFPTWNVDSLLYRFLLAVSFDELILVLFQTARMSRLSQLFPSNSRILIDGGLVD
jgi:hypothetical protein